MIPMNILECAVRLHKLAATEENVDRSKDLRAIAFSLEDEYKRVVLELLQSYEAIPVEKMEEKIATHEKREDQLAEAIDRLTRVLSVLNPYNNYPSQIQPLYWNNPSSYHNQFIGNSGGGAGGSEVKNELR